MADELKPIVLTFGYGINRRSRPQDIDMQECYDGENFDLSHQFFALHRRDAFTLVSIAPNGQEIRGWAQLVNRDGTVSTIIQAGGDIYSLTFATDWVWTLVGSVLPTARLRGPKSQNWLLDGYVIVTDLEKVETVRKWDGSTFGEFGHNLTSDLYAKFCRVHGERAYFGNVRSGSDTPQVILASKLGDAEILTVNNRPASSLSDEDPFFLPTPDLRPVNGIEKGFGQLFFSTQEGQLHRLSGSTAKDFELISFYEGSAVSGDEALLNIGNDILMGLEGRIETLSGTLNFGDVETDDTSQWIRPLVENTRTWRLVYNRRLQKVYAIPDSGGLVWVLSKALLNAAGGNLGEARSPWSKWTTTHEIAFSPSTIWSMICPCSGLERVFFGDQFGRVFAFEGGAGQDGAPARYSPAAVDFVGGGYLERFQLNVSELQTIGQKALLSFWIKPTTTNTVIFSNTGGFLVFNQAADKNMSFQVRLGDGGIQRFITPADSLPTGTWSHVLALLDSMDPTPPAYINNVLVATTTDGFAGTFATLSGWASTYFRIGYLDLFPGSGCLSEVWLDGFFTGNVTDELRRKFITDDNRPVDLGRNGQNPTGLPALIYLPHPYETAGINDGTGGDFAILNGPLAACTTNPIGEDGSERLGAGEGTATDIRVYRRSKIIELPGLDEFDIKGWITYLRAFAATVTLTFEFGGTNIFDQTVTIQLPANPDVGVYNGDAYYNDSAYYNAGFTGRLSRQKFSAAGRSSFCQVKVEVDGAEDIEISEIGLWLAVAKDK